MSNENMELVARILLFAATLIRALAALYEV